MTLRHIAKIGGMTIAAGAISLCVAQSAPTPAPVAASVPATATAPAPAPVQVMSHGDQIEVKVPDQAPLSAVMSSVCQQQKLKCTGTETLASYRGPAMSVDGTLRQVISKLVEGTDINYEFSRSAEGGATAISFLGHAPRGTAYVAAPEQPAAPVPGRPLHPHAFPGRFPPGSVPPPPNTPAPQSQMTQPGSGAESNPQLTTAQAEQMRKSEEAMKAMFTDTGAVQDPGSLPFPDQNGKPIKTTDTPATGLPFPDQFGNPIPAKPGPTGSPFPITSKPAPPASDSSDHK